MDIEQAKYVLRGFPLNGLDVRNLQLGRITRIAMREVLTRVSQQHGIQCTGLAVSLRLADELNDLLEAARAVMEADNG